jgi:cyclic pyranopterin monophosphate synthase
LTAMGRRTAARLTHTDRSGRIRMVDVGEKPVTVRDATAQGAIAVSAGARRLVRAGQLRKGDPLEAARLAGIMAAKRTSELIPLCHPIALTHVAIEIAQTRSGYRITATARTAAQTGVEMEALTAVAAAALTIYDMLKAVDREMVIGEICLLEKKGGRSGHYRRSRGREVTGT